VSIQQKLKELAGEYTILCVDDDPVTLKRLEIIFKNFFKAVYIAENGSDGLKKYKELKPDIVITDIVMADLSGLDMADEIKRLNPSAKVLVLSAYDDKDYLMRSLNIGVDRYVKKPINNDDIQKHLLKILEGLATLRGLGIKPGNQGEEKPLCSVNGSEDLFKIFDIIKEEEIDIKAVNQYKGITISNNCKIGKIAQNRVYLLCDRIQATVAMLEKYMVLHCGSFEKDILAKIRNVFKQKGKYIVEVSDFVHLQFSPLRRKDIRVEPDENILASFFYKGKPYPVKILDISKKAISLKLENVLEKLKIGEDIDLKIFIKKEQKTAYHITEQSSIINCRGTLSRIDDNESRKKVVVFIFYKNLSDQKEIYDYLATRQKKLIEELREILSKKF